MDLTVDGVFRYRGFCGNAAECYLRVYQASGRPAVVVASELDSNRGTSIIHMVTHLAGWVWQMLERPAGGLIWIEHIPRSGTGEESVDAGRFADATVLPLCRVDFGGSSGPCMGTFISPAWTPISREELKNLIR